MNVARTRASSTEISSRVLAQVVEAHHCHSREPEFLALPARVTGRVRPTAMVQPVQPATAPGGAQLSGLFLATTLPLSDTVPARV